MEVLWELVAARDDNCEGWEERSSANAQLIRRLFVGINAHAATRSGQKLDFPLIETEAVTKLGCVAARTR
jgi:hypothetical protein